MADGFHAESSLTSLVFAAGSPVEELMRTIKRIAASDATVLLTGETGTGKEVFARAVHAEWTARTHATGAFIPVNCGAIPETLIEAELFGHAKGAFTGAHTARKGRVAMAEGGTLFLDEIGELPLGPQVKLLRLLQERTYEPIGDNKTVRANFRLVAATNRDLRAEVKAGRFREDLFYRLFVFPLELPALRERPMDVAPLVAHFWAKLGEKRPFSSQALRALAQYAWPGNIRELENLMHRMSVCCDGPVVELRDLPRAYREHVEPTPAPTAVVALPTVSADASASPCDVIIRELTAMAPEIGERDDEICADVETRPSFVVTPALTSADAGVRASSSTPLGTTAFTVAPHASPASAPEDQTPSVAARPAPAAFLARSDAPTMTVALPNDLSAFLRDLERSIIERALAQTGGNRQAAARLLGLGRTTLVEKIRRFESDLKTTHLEHAAQSSM
jgi:sigma-54 specific flagellar transcriptional regulator A